MNPKYLKQAGIALSFFILLQAITPDLVIATQNVDTRQQEDTLIVHNEVSSFNLINEKADMPFIVDEETLDRSFLPDNGILSQNEIQKIEENMISKFLDRITTIDEHDVLPTPSLDNNTLTHFNSFSNTKIHFLNLDGDTDSILLESNGHFGMVDSGEDNDYPDGSNPNYPLRPGTTINQGFEDQVIAYLKKVGVEKLDFYIGTHAHSDHIGSGDEILDAFPVDTLYLAEYKDEYNFNDSTLYDNLYCYDNLIAAAKRNGTTIIQDFENSDLHSFSLGDMSIEIMNYDRETDENGVIIPVDNDNHNSLAVKVTAANQVALLGGDMNNLESDYDETKIADQFENSIDLLKLCHHGYPGSNSAYFINKIAPTYAILSGRLINMNNSTFETVDTTTTTLLSTRWFQDNDAIIANFKSSGIEMTAPNDIVIASYGSTSPELVAYQNGRRIKTPNTWLSNEEKEYFIGPNGTLVTGHLNIGSNSYYFNANGEMITGLLNDKGDYYYYGLDGILKKSGWILINKDYYYSTSSGKLAIGLLKIDGILYGFNNQAKMIKGPASFDGTNYFFDRISGAVINNGWINDEGAWFFANSNGTLMSGWLPAGGNTKFYFIPDTGKLATGWFQVDNKWYYSDNNGYMLTGWIISRGTWYYLSSNGEMQTGWIKPDGNYYYLDPIAGDMKTGWYTYNKKRYYSSESGIMKTGWIRPDGNYYYLDPINGDLKTNWYIYNNHWYFSSESGIMQTGWIRPDGNYYYLDPINGDMKTNWYVYNNTWYFSSLSGVMQTGWIKDSFGLWYYLSGSGSMVRGWLQDGQKWYYLNPAGGSMQIGWFTVGANWFYATPNGSIYTDTTIKIGNLTYTFSSSGTCLNPYQ